MMDKLSAVNAIINSVMGKFNSQIDLEVIFVFNVTARVVDAWWPMRTEIMCPTTIEEVATYQVTLASIQVMSG